MRSSAAGTVRVNLYEVLGDGYHTALTSSQISALFHAKRINRDTRCKRIEEIQWQAVDELFPLLKYDSCGSRNLEPPRGSASRTFVDVIVVVICVAASAALGLLGYFGFYKNSAGMGHRREAGPAIEIRSSAPYDPVGHSDPTSATVSSSGPAARGSAQVLIPQTVAINPPVARSYYESPVAAVSAARKEGLKSEQLEREKAAALANQRRREVQEEERQRQRLAGTDVVFPLDTYATINVGATPVTLKLHDNDVTSFDVWTNGSVRRNVKKEKGISHTRNDETLIYSTGAAALYYVWEISGTLNHCLLRVREE